MHATTIVAYTFRAETLCPECVLDALEVQRSVRDEIDLEAILDALASAVGIDRDDERSFDSGDFPKVVFADQVQWEAIDVPDDSFIGQGFRAERCDSCDAPLI